jgi:hypothetical protein
VITSTRCARRVFSHVVTQGTGHNLNWVLREQVLEPRRDSHESPNTMTPTSEPEFEIWWESAGLEGRRNRKLECSLPFRLRRGTHYVFQSNPSAHTQPLVLRTAPPSFPRVFRRWSSGLHLRSNRLTAHTALLATRQTRPRAQFTGWRSFHKSWNSRSDAPHMAGPPGPLQTRSLKLPHFSPLTGGGDWP